MEVRKKYILVFNCLRSSAEHFKRSGADMHMFPFQKVFKATIAFPIEDRTEICSVWIREKQEVEILMEDVLLGCDCEWTMFEINQDYLLGSAKPSLDIPLRTVIGTTN